MLTKKRFSRAITPFSFFVFVLQAKSLPFCCCSALKLGTRVSFYMQFSLQLIKHNGIQDNHSAVWRVLGIESTHLGIVLGIESIPKSWLFGR